MVRHSVRIERRVLERTATATVTAAARSPVGVPPALAWQVAVQWLTALNLSNARFKALGDDVCSESAAAVAKQWYLSRNVVGEMRIDAAMLHACAAG